MTIATSDHAPSVEVRVRDAVPPPVVERVEAVVDELDSLEDRGVIEGWTVARWGRSVPDAGLAGADTPELERVRAYEAWAAETDRTLRPGFRRRECTSLVTEGAREVVDVPVLCVAFVVDGSVRAVYPCAADGTVHTVADGLRSLAGPGPDTEPTQSTV